MAYVIVADVNLIVYHYIPGPFTAAAVQARMCDADWLVPSVWKFEYVNVLATSVREKILIVEVAMDGILLLCIQGKTILKVRLGT